MQSQEVTYAELTMPRNKGYAPMRAKSTESPINAPAAAAAASDAAHQLRHQHSVSSFKIRNPPPQPPPRYTSPPRRSGTGVEEPLLGGGGGRSQDMPLVSQADGGGGNSSLPRDFRDRRGILGNRRARELRSDGSGGKSGRPMWGSIPEGIQEGDAEGHEHIGSFESEGGAESDTAVMTDQELREKRRRMMARMRTCRTQQQLSTYASSPDMTAAAAARRGGRRGSRCSSEVINQSQDSSERGVPVPQGLLERRRVLIKALTRIKTPEAIPEDEAAATSNNSSHDQQQDRERELEREWASLPESFDRRRSQQYQPQQMMIQRHQQQQPQHHQQHSRAMSTDDKRHRLVRWHSSAHGMTPAMAASADSSRPSTPGGTRRQLPRIPSASEQEFRRQQRQQSSSSSGLPPYEADSSSQSHPRIGPPPLSPFRRQMSMVMTSSSFPNSVGSSARNELLETIQSGSFSSNDSYI